MGDYFSPWRRKIGVVTLMMACVTMVGWVRSRLNNDFVLISIGSLRSVFVSGGQKFCLILPCEPQLEVFFVQTTNGVDSPKIWRIEAHNFEEEAFSQHSKVGYITRVAYPGQKRFRLIPYWSLTIPLTLLSLWLLLFNPRTSTQKKSPEPIAVEGN